MTFLDLEFQIQKSKKQLIEEGYLALGERLKIWRIFGEKFVKNNNSNGKNYLPGHKRRTYLFKLCSKKIMHFWKERMPNDTILDDVMELVQNYLKRNYPPISDSRFIQADNLLLMLEDYPYEDRVVLVGYAILATFRCAIYDLSILNSNDTSIPEDTDFDINLWYADYSASLMYAGGFGSKEKKEKLTEFWNWYLDTAVLEAYNLVKD